MINELRKKLLHHLKSNMKITIKYIFYLGLYADSGERMKSCIQLFPSIHKNWHQHKFYFTVIYNLKIRL